MAKSSQALWFGLEGAPAKTSSTFVGYFQVPGVALSLHVWLVKFWTASQTQGRDVSHDPLARVQLGKTAELWFQYKNYQRLATELQGGQVSMIIFWWGGNFASHNPSLEHKYWGQKLQGESARWYRFVACSSVLNSLDQLHLGGGNAAVGILQCWSVGHGTLDRNAGKSSMLNQRMMNDFICNM